MLFAVLSSFVVVANGLQVAPSVLSQKRWHDLGASEATVQSAKACDATVPTRIQALAFKAVSDGSHTLIAEQTGSGKTLAYVLPLLQKLREEEDSKKLVTERVSSIVCPRVVVLAPTGELANQVAQVWRQASRGERPVRVRCATGNTEERSAERSLRRGGGCDVLVATPGRLAALLDRRALNLASATDVVLDEVDVLALADGGAGLEPLVSAQSARFVFVTATMPKKVEKQLTIEFPDLRKCKGPGLHRPPPGLVIDLIECYEDNAEQRQRTQRSALNQFSDDVLLLDDDDDHEAQYSRRRHTQPKKKRALPSRSLTKGDLDRKKEALLKAIRLGRPDPDQKKTEKRLRLPKRTLVFCNTIETCRKVENALIRADRRGHQRKVLAYHSALKPESLKSNLASFLQTQSLPQVLVCTDRASRGVDFGAKPVDHVVLFDWPRDPNEFLRRVGRTARAGRTGYATIIVAGANIPVARKVTKACRDGKPIVDDVDGSIFFDDDDDSRDNRKTQPPKANSRQGTSRRPSSSAAY